MLRRAFVVQFLMLMGSSMWRASPAKRVAESGPRRASVQELVTAVDDLLRALQPGSRKEIEFSFDDGERGKWSNVPNAVQPRRGLAFGRMSDSERIAAHRLLRAMTSTQGYLKATGVMSLESILREIHAPDLREYFSPDFYFLSLFGRPGVDSRWAVRIDGHHLALHLTVLDGQIISTPLFLGTEPATVLHGQLTGLRVLGAETMKGFALRNALTAGQVKLAVLAQELPPDIFTGPGHDDALRRPAGIATSQLQGIQRQLLESLIDEYLDNMHPESARSQRSEVQKHGMDGLHFAWMGPPSMGKPVYYRVHGPSLLIEYDNSLAVGTETKINDPNHIHTILRVPGNDFGEDWLRKHHRQTLHK